MAVSSALREAQALKKGLACLNCRRKKIKCDGKRPICQPCSKSTRSNSQCEYADQNSGARTHQLEQEIVSLQSKIEEMEKLADPFLLGAGKEWGVPEWVGAEHLMPPSDIMAQLVHSFLKHAPDFGFFLDLKRLDVITYCPICRNAIFLWAVHLAGPDSPWSKCEPILLSRSLAFLTTGIAKDCGESELICTLQGHVLLANYYCHCGRFLEGRSQLSAACSLIQGIGLHRIGALVDPHVPSSFYPTEAPHSELPDSTPVDLEERIRCFWTVVTLTNVWTGMDDIPSYLEMVSSEVTTPWPDSGGPSGSGKPVVKQFMDNVPDDARSLDALLAKSALLFAKASCVARQYRPGLSPHESQALFTEFVSLDNLIQAFAMNLEFASDAPARRVLLVRSLTCASTIKLHRRYISVSPISRQKCATAAKTIASFTTGFGGIGLYQKVQDRALWKVWVLACEILTDELRMHQQTYGFGFGSDASSLGEGHELRTLTDGIDTLLGSLSQSIHGCPIAQARFAKLQNGYAAASAGQLVLDGV